MNCCDAAKACGKGSACGDDMVAMITPSATFSDDFVPLLGCMQEHCDDECGVSWGCIDDYDVAAADDEYQVPVQIVDFAAVPPRLVPDVTTDACRSLDPGCDSGRVARASQQQERSARALVAGELRRLLRVLRRRLHRGDRAVERARLPQRGLRTIAADRHRHPKLRARDRRARRRERRLRSDAGPHHLPRAELPADLVHPSLAAATRGSCERAGDD